LTMLASLKFFELLPGSILLRAWHALTARSLARKPLDHFSLHRTSNSDYIILSLHDRTLLSTHPSRICLYDLPPEQCRVVVYVDNHRLQEDASCDYLVVAEEQASFVPVPCVCLTQRVTACHGCGVCSEYVTKLLRLRLSERNHSRNALVRQHKRLEGICTVLTANMYAH
jgi:hypothetical protein